MPLTYLFGGVTSRGFSRGIEEVFCGKHKPYGFMVEAEVLPNGLAISVSNHYPGLFFLI